MTEQNEINAREVEDEFKVTNVVERRRKKGSIQRWLYTEGLLYVELEQRLAADRAYSINANQYTNVEGGQRSMAVGGCYTVLLCAVRADHKVEGFSAQKLHRLKCHHGNEMQMRLHYRR